MEWRFLTSIISQKERRLKTYRSLEVPFESVRIKGGIFKTCPPWRLYFKICPPLEGVKGEE